MTGLLGTSSALVMLLHGQAWIALVSAVCWAAGRAATAAGVTGGVKPTAFHWSIGAVGSVPAVALASPDGDGEPAGLDAPGVAEAAGVVLTGVADEAGAVLAAACGTTRP